MTARLPADIALAFVLGTFTEQRRLHVDEFDTDSGHRLTSKKPGTPLSDIAGEIVVSAAVKTSLESFHATTLGEGALPFEAVLARGSAAEIYSFAVPPAYRDIAGQVAFRVSIALLRE